MQETKPEMPIISPGGMKKWHDETGKLHRVGGPAVIWPDGDQAWYQNSKLHRTDGPAFMLDGIEIWCVNGKEIDIKPILERLEISPDWKSWTEEEKFLVRLALP